MLAPVPAEGLAKDLRAVAELVEGPHRMGPAQSEEVGEDSPVAKMVVEGIVILLDISILVLMMAQTLPTLLLRVWRVISLMILLRWRSLRRVAAIPMPLLSILILLGLSH